MTTTRWYQSPNLRRRERHASIRGQKCRNQFIVFRPKRFQIPFQGALLQGFGTVQNIGNALVADRRGLCGLGTRPVWRSESNRLVLFIAASIFASYSISSYSWQQSRRRICLPPSLARARAAVVAGRRCDGRRRSGCCCSCSSRSHRAGTGGGCGLCHVAGLVAAADTAVIVVVVQQTKGGAVDIRIAKLHLRIEFRVHATIQSIGFPNAG